MNQYVYLGSRLEDLGFREVSYPNMCIVNKALLALESLVKFVKSNNLCTGFGHMTGCRINARTMLTF